MGDIILNESGVLYKWGTDCLKIRPLREEDLYISSEPLEHIDGPLFRFLEECYVDGFLNEGRLRLSNFEACKDIEDANRRDRHEGFGTLYATDGRSTVAMSVRLGMNPLMLCCAKDINSYSRHSTGLRIFDPTGLRDAITKALLQKGRKIRQIMQGNCEYANRMIYKRVSPDNPAFNAILELKDPRRKKLEYGVIDSFVRAIGGQALYFRKPIDCKQENEYRIVWDCNRMEGDEYEDIVIENPGAYAEKCLKK